MPPVTLSFVIRGLFTKVSPHPSNAWHQPQRRPFLHAPLSAARRCEAGFPNSTRQDFLAIPFVDMHREL
jgi:hypothetical protein